MLDLFLRSNYLGASILLGTGSMPKPFVAKPLEPVELAMTQGGSEQLVLDAKLGINAFFTAPRPRESIIARSSATNSYSSRWGYLAAQGLYDQLRATQKMGGSSRCFEYSMHTMRDSIKKHWGRYSLQESYVMTAPSRASAVMMSVVAALGRHPLWRAEAPSTTPLVTHIIVAGYNVDAEVLAARQLRHAGTRTPIKNGVVQAGGLIAGLKNGVVRAQLCSVRDEVGKLISTAELELKLSKLITTAIDIECTIAIVQIAPSDELGVLPWRDEWLASLKRQYKNRLLIVVDASQLRVHESAIGAWIDKNFWVMLGASTFLGGAQGADALLLPRDEALMVNNVAAQHLLKGLSDYFTSADCDEIFAQLKAVLPFWQNEGLALRWQAALAEADRFCSVDGAVRDRGLYLWVQGVRAMVRSSHNLVLFDDLIPTHQLPDYSASIGKCNTIIALGVRVVMPTRTYGYLDKPDLEKVRLLMMSDLTKVLPQLSSDDKRVAATSCYVGAPVQVAPQAVCKAVLTIAIAAPDIYKAIGQERLDPSLLVDSILYDDRVLVRKLELIVANWHLLTTFVV
jgi:hypothetical protein